MIKNDDIPRYLVLCAAIYNNIILYDRTAEVYSYFVRGIYYIIRYVCDYKLLYCRLLDVQHGPQS